MRQSPDKSRDPAPVVSAGEADSVTALPRISIQAFCASREVYDTLVTAAGDRRASRTQMTVHTGGLSAAVEAYEDASTPNVIMVESADQGDKMIAELDALAEVCDPDTSVIVIGHTNDVLLYRQLMTRGVSEYIVWPFGPVDALSAISRLFAAQGLETLGKTIAFVGAKGGVGASAIAHNVAWSMAQELTKSVTVLDLDLAFGTAGLDFNQDPPQGIADAIYAGERLDMTFVDKLFYKCTERLSLIAAPSTLDRDYDLSYSAIEPVIDLVRASVPYLVLDVPHQWTNWTRKMMVAADDVVIVAAPDLANLRNAKNMVDLLMQARQNDRKPYLLLNQVGVPKRPEITAKDFGAALGLEVFEQVAFDPNLFGTASNNGQMVAEVQPNAKPVEAFGNLARSLVGYTEAPKASSSLLSNLLGKLPLSSLKLGQEKSA